MPASPADGAEFSSAVSDLVGELELWLLRLLASQLRTVRAESWEADALAALQRWRALAARGVAGAEERLQKAVAETILKARAEGMVLAAGDLRDLGVTMPVPAAATGATGAAETLAVQLVGVLSQTPRLIEPIYVEAVRAGASEVLGGKVTRLQAAQHVLDRLGSQGITGYRDATGRNWSLTSYVEMAVRTESGHQAVQGHVDALVEAGLDLVVVSDVPGECEMCRPWEGKVLSLTGQVGAVIMPSAVDDRSVRVDVAATLDEARRAGFQHPNCRHNVTAYVPGATRLRAPRQEPGAYEARQRQRAMERKVREWKRREALALDDAAAAKARGKVREWQGALRGHVREHDLKRLRRREQTGVAI